MKGPKATRYEVLILRHEAIEECDDVRIALCNRALRGSPTALRVCARLWARFEPVAR